ncbi:MAG: hypothetical protein NZM12_04065, partial [Steroidobacteraceae bacterium]|nr:hypothetical protein [Steroidobacteraceae bacterium]MDW8260101.1 hypothetical protein [Gammaproteobacteria bacterium]
PPVGAAELAPPPVWERPWFQQLSKLLAGLILVIVLIFIAIKPALQQLLATLKSHSHVKSLPQPGSVASGATAMTPVGVTGNNAATAAVANNNLQYEQQVAQARTLVSQDPARVAQVVKGWVSADG